MKAVFTPISRYNPYQKLLGRALEKNNIEVIFSSIFPKMIWLWKNRHDVQIIHIHWPSSLYRMGRLTSLRAIVFLLRMIWAKLLGYHFVWTVHNTLPHESDSPYWDRFFRKLLVRSCGGIISHCEKSLFEIQERFGKAERSKIMPHGHYMGYYPTKPTRSFARERLGLPMDAFVLLFFGQLREYKGLFSLIDQLQTFKHDVTLVIAGRGEMDSSIQEKARNCGVTVKCYFGFIPDAEVSIFFAAADAMIAPFEKILTSGSVILGLSMGLPVVAPALGCLPELLCNGSGILYDPSSPVGLSNALAELFATDLGRMGNLAQRRATQLDWGEIGRETCEFYRQIVGSG